MVKEITGTGLVPRGQISKVVGIEDASLVERDIIRRKKKRESPPQPKSLIVPWMITG